MENMSANVTAVRSPEDPNMLILTDNDTGVTYDPIHISQIWELFNEDLVNTIMQQLYTPPAPTPPPVVTNEQFTQQPHNLFGGMGGFGAWADDFHALASPAHNLDRFPANVGGNITLVPGNDNAWYWTDPATGQKHLVTRQQLNEWKQSGDSVLGQLAAQIESDIGAFGGVLSDAHKGEYRLEENPAYVPSETSSSSAGNSFDMVRSRGAMGDMKSGSSYQGDHTARKAGLVSQTKNVDRSYGRRAKPKDDGTRAAAKPVKGPRGSSNQGAKHMNARFRQAASRMLGGKR